MSLADYLAKNYLSADKPAKKSKKRKRKDPAGLTIADDDAPGWDAHAAYAAAAAADDHGPPTTVVAGRSAEFRKAKSSAWKTVGAAAPSNSEQAAADAILAAADAEDAQRRAAEDDAPEVLDEDDVLRMESGAQAGLQTAEQVAADVRRKEEREKREYEATMREMAGVEKETIYRDASGRIVNVAMKRAEARKKAEDDARKKAEEDEAAKGDVQRAEKEKRRQDLADAKYLAVARGVDDEARNAELKEEERWNDPAAQFLAKKKKGRSTTGKPLYQGAAPPNRYQIRPGHRWDGVDRSNGFEREYFAAQNNRRNIKDLEYAWQMDE